MAETGAQDIARLRQSINQSSKIDAYEREKKYASFDKAMETQAREEERTTDYNIRQAWNSLEKLSNEYNSKVEAIQGLNILISQIGGDKYTYQDDLKSTVKFGELGNDLQTSLSNLKNDSNTLRAEIDNLNEIISDQEIKKSQLEAMKNFYQTVPSVDIYGEGNKIDREDVSADAFMQLYPQMDRTMAEDMSSRWALPAKVLREQDAIFQETIIQRKEAQTKREQDKRSVALAGTLDSKFASTYNVIMTDAQESFDEGKTLSLQDRTKVRTSGDLRKYVSEQIIMSPYTPMPNSPFYGHKIRGNFPMSRLLIDVDQLSSIENLPEEEYSQSVARLSTAAIDMYHSATDVQTPNPQQLSSLAARIKRNYDYYGNTGRTMDQKWYREAVLFSFGIDPSNVETLIDDRYSSIDDFQPDSHISSQVKHFSDKQYSDWTVKQILEAEKVGKNNPNYGFYLEKRQILDISSKKYNNLKQSNQLPILTEQLLNDFRSKGIFSDKTYNKHKKRIGKPMNRVEFIGSTFNSLYQYFQLGD